MEDNAVVFLGNKFIRIENWNCSIIPSTSYWLFARLSTIINLYMDTIMYLLPLLLCIIKSSCVENQIAWSHLLFCKYIWTGIQLIVLIPSTKSKTKVFSKISDNLSYQSTTIKEDRWIVKFGSLFMIFSGLRNSDILLSSINKFLS